MSEPDTLGADTLGRVFVKVSASQFMAMAQRSQPPKGEDGPSWLVVARNAFWALAGGFCVVALVLTLLRMSAAYRAESVLLSWLWVGTVAFLFCALHTHTTINQRRILAKADETRDELRGEIRDARPADAEQLGQTVAELQANRELIRLMREEMAANERQRQADFDQIRDNSRKAIEGLHHDVELLRGELPSMLEEAGHRGFVEGFKAAYEAIATVAEAGVELPSAQGLEQVAAGGVVIPLPSAETMEALRRLARKTARAEDNFEDRTG